MLFILNQRNPVMSNAKPISIPAHLGKQLLTDLQDYFARQSAKHYPTEQLLNYLAGIHAAPWATFADGKAITARHLARLLQPYGIVPKNIRLSATSTPKGYKVADFDAALTQLNSLPPHATTVADHVADKKVMDNNDVAANEMTPSDVAANVAANLNNLVNVAVSDVADNDVAANVAANVADNVVDKVDVTDRNSVVADKVAAPIPAQPTQKWPPPKGWTWNYKSRCYEPPAPTVQSEPMDQELIRQTLHVSPNLQYVPGKGLISIHELPTMA